MYTWWFQCISLYSWTLTISCEAYTWTLFWGTLMGSFCIYMKIVAHIHCFLILGKKWFISLQGPKYEVEMKGRCNLMERSAKISENLNIVEVKCQVVDQRVLKVLKFLCTFNISKLTCNFPCDSTWKFTTKLLTNEHPLTCWLVWIGRKTTELPIFGLLVTSE